MQTETRAEVHHAYDWEVRLDRASRKIAREVLSIFTETDGRRRAADFVLGIARMAIRPAGEVATRGTTRLDDGREVECITGPGVLRLAFEDDLGDWSDPGTSTRIIDVVLSAVADELHLDPIQLAAPLPIIC